MSMIGHNSATPADLVRDTFTALGDFLKNTPVIEAGQAKAAGLLVERIRKTIADADDARKAEVGPLNAKVKIINAEYKHALVPLEHLFEELRWRLTDFAGREEAKRRREAENLRLAADEAERAARMAEEAEREVKENATLGEITDVAAAIVDADQKFNEFGRLDRAAAVAERNTSMRIPSQLGGRALSMREHETLVLDDWRACIDALTLTERLRDAILAEARNYRRKNGELPNGVSATYSRSI
jgi:hypothetical protein